MFWLFRRKKVADKKSITPCVCDNSSVEREDSYDMHEFTATECNRGTLRSTSEGALSRLTLGSNSDNRGTKKGYHRLQGDVPQPSEVTPAAASTSQQSAAEATHPSPPTQQTALEPKVPPLTTPDYESASSSTDYSDDYGGFNSDSYDDEELTCNVCDRSFYSVRHLLQHQQKKRHYGCSVCDSIFPNLMALEMHKETLDHWSEDDELRFHDTDSDDDDDDYYDHLYGRVPQELERLL